MSEEGFIMSADQAMIFFRFCRRYKIEGMEARKRLAREMVRRKEAKYIRDVGSFIEGKRVIGFKPREGGQNDRG